MVTLDQIDLKNLSPEDLGELLISAKKAYYTGGKPIMDDHTYDTLENILKQKLPYHRIFTKVGAPNFNTGFDKKTHTIPMGSLNKVTNFDDLVHYFELKKISHIELVIQPKCDGISLEIEYQNGKLVNAITRGDGIIGDLITQNVIKMKNFVKSLPDDFSGSIRCEIVVTKKDFEELNDIVSQDTSLREGTPTKQSLPEDRHNSTSLATTYSNPRNAASGLSQRLDGKYSNLCSLYAVDILPQNTEIYDISTEYTKIDLLEFFGFTPVESLLCHSFHEIETIYQRFLNTKRQDYPYEIDGLVIKINDLNVARELGVKNNRPKYQVAYKFPADSNQTQINKIFWQVGPMGSITPVAEVEPIELSGAIISFASLGNYDLVIKKDLNIGDIIEISRRGDVIPHIEKVITKVTHNHIDIPTNCPDCGTLLIKEDKNIRCPNQKNCMSQILGSLRLFCDTLGILGLSDKTIRKLYQADKIRLPGDFYKLTIDDISGLDNLGEKSGKNIISQIQSKRSLTLKQVFDAAVIPHFSTARVQQLIDAGFNTPQKLLDIKVDNLLLIKGFQKTLAQKIVNGITLRHSWINSIISNVDIKLPTTNNLSLKGLNFCITGDLSIPRPQFIEKVESNGGKIVSAVSKNTNYLVSNKNESNSSKFISAKKLNIPIISENDFYKLINA
ncbi:MAG TPA: BRCT domain-containing protein [Candidatus Methanoperedens sp.]|nr:BRCT domain-containing protein [Candidatus Methanoperedens sp.]